MKKREVDIQNSPELKKFLIDFCNAKMAIYRYSKKEFNQKVENFFKNIKKINFAPKKSLRGCKGTYNYRKKELCLYSENLNELSEEEILALVHELNHAWNFEPNKRHGIIPKTGIRSKLKNLLDFKIWEETINEAETQALCSSQLRKTKEESSEENTFNGYIEEESLFEMLCIICNQTGMDFLKDIEGQDILGIIKHISNQSKVPEEEVNNTIQNIAAIYTRLKTNVNKFNLKLSLNLMSAFRKSQDLNIMDILPEMNIKEGQQIYETLKSFIKNSGYNSKEKELISLKFEALQDRMALRFFEFEELQDKFISHEEYDKNNPDSKFNFDKIESDASISYRKIPLIFKTEKESIFKRHRDYHYTFRFEKNHSQTGFFFKYKTVCSVKTIP